MPFRFSIGTCYSILWRCTASFAVNWFLVNRLLRVPIFRLFGVQVGLYVGRGLLAFLWAAAAFIWIAFYQGRDEDAERDYKSALGKEPYDRKADLTFILKDGELYGECLSVAIFLIVILLRIFRSWLLPLNLVLYFVSAVVTRLVLHRKWAGERKILPPDDESV